MEKEKKHTIKIGILLTAFVIAALLMVVMLNSLSVSTKVAINPNTVLDEDYLETEGQQPANLDLESCGIILFYGEDCPHCHTFAPILEEAEKQVGCSVQKLEIYYNEVNYNTLMDYSDKIIETCGKLGVPTLYAPSTEQALCGNRALESTIRFLNENKEII